jgi:hypothetical protein
MGREVTKTGCLKLNTRAGVQLSKTIAEANWTREKISGEFVVACGDGSKMPELIEEALDEVAFAVEREIAKPVGFAVRFRRDDRSDFPAGSGWR